MLLMRSVFINVKTGISKLSRQVGAKHTTRLHDISSKSQMKHPATTQCHQDVSVAHIHDIPLLRPYDSSCKSQMKHIITLLWYVSSIFQSYVVATFSTFPSYFVMSSIWQVFTSHLSIKSNTKFFQYQPEGKQ